MTGSNWQQGGWSRHSAMTGLSVNISVAVYPLSPYSKLLIEDGKLKAAGCLGTLWNELVDDLDYSVNSIYSESRSEYHDVVLAAGTNAMLPTGIHHAFFTTWYDVHLEEGERAQMKLSYLSGSSTIWYLYIAMIFIHSILLFIMLRIAERFCSNSAIDLLPIPKLEKLWRYQNFFPKLRNQAKLYSQLRVRNEESLGNCVMASLAAVSNQGSYLRSHVPSIRLALLTFLALGLIMNNAYSAMLISQFAASQSALEIAAGWMQSGTTFCKRPNSLPYNMVDKYGSSVTDENCGKNLCLGMPTYETVEIMNEHRLTCQFRPFKVQLTKFNVGIDVAVTAPHFLRADIRNKIIKFREFGLTTRITRQSMKFYDQQLASKHYDNVAFQQIVYPYGLYFAMIIVSCMILGGEIFFFKKIQWQP